MTVIPLAPQRLPLLHVDDERWEVHVAGYPVQVTRLEMLVLTALYDARGRVLTRDGLAERVGVYSGGSRTLDVHVCRLRRKLGPAARLLVTVRGVGWKLLPG
jgi:two-component system phosphate regulon response regulator PhoB